MVRPKSQPDVPKSLVEYIKDQIIHGILQGNYRPGQQLIEAKLQEQMGVSRTPIREAFRILEQHGFLMNVARKGTYVRKITDQDIRNQFPIRANLEGLAARLATAILTQKDFKAMQSALSRMEKAGKAKNFMSYFTEHDKFHMVFIDGSTNGLLIAMVKTLRRHALWFRLSYKWHQENYQHILPIHADILRLFENRDADGAERLVKDHILMSEKGYLEILTSREMDGLKNSAKPDIRF
jgi:DNA-binding GntR family transcriptional regulator